MDSDAKFVTLAFVVKTQGRHGEVAVELHSAPNRFAEGMKLFALGKGQDSRRELEIEEVWPHKEWLVLKFRGIGSISDAETLIGSELQLPCDQRALLEPGWNFVSDLTGCAVFDKGREIGRVADVVFGAGEAPLLIVADATGKEFDVPFAEAFLESVDVSAKQVRMTFPEGLLEVNAPLTQEEKREQARPERKKN